MTVLVDMDFIVKKRDGSDEGEAWDIVTMHMPSTILRLRSQSRTQEADWLDDALEQFTDNKYANISGDQYFFVMKYVDFDCGSFFYKKAQLLKRFVP